MDREILISALWWFGVVWVVVGIFAFSYAFIVDGPAETFLSYVWFAIGVLLAPGIAAMFLSTFLESRAE